MIRLHYANRLESLIAPLADAIGAQQRADPLGRVTIVVPSRVIADFLQHRVSEAIGIAANFEFPFLRRFLAEVIERADSKIRILEVEELELLLFESLRVALRDHPHDFSAPLGYVEKGEPNGEEKELRTFRLARHLAPLFREYSITRRSMLQGWTRDRESDGEPRSETESWQRQLWRSIFGAQSYLHREWKNDHAEYNWLLLPDAFEAVAAGNLKTALPPVVHLFGLAYAGPAYLRILAQIGDLIELHLYTLNPCLEFWEDVEHLSGADRESWSRRHSKIGGDLEQSPDPFNLAAAGDTPALRLWARPGREYIRMLNEVTECDFEAHFVPQNPSAASSLLDRLQEDVLNRSPERVPGQSDLPDDGSLRFLACPGIAREAEIVANEIWSMLDHESSGRDTPRFHQIAVMVPDAQYADYLPHLESAFHRLHQLPTNIVNRGSSSQSPVREAISLLLRLPLGRFSRDEMLHLLNHPAIRGEDVAVETEQAGRWCEELGIFFGADANDLASTYIPRDTYHWDQGIRRLALGVFMGAERDQEAQFYRGPESLEYLPCAIAQEELSAAAGFIHSARRLLFDATAIRSHKLTLQQWSRLLSDLILTYIHVDDPAAERARERCVEAIESIVNPELSTAPVGYQIVHEIVSARLAELESQLVHFTESGIAIGPLSALRALPFRAIFLMGLNEANFPERDRRDPMDLRLARRKAGDVTPTERDRYLFLETLLAARQRICMSYVARDSRTGDQLDPSSVVRELQFILRGYVNGETLDRLTIQHPLSRYDSEYFPDLPYYQPTNGRKLTSYDSEARRGAAMAALRRDLAHSCGDLPLPDRDELFYQQLDQQSREAMWPALRMVQVPLSPEARMGPAAEISLPISALRKFLECPLQGAAQYALGIFEDDGDGLEQWQDEPVAQSILDRTSLLREVFWKARGDRQLVVSEYEKAFRISQFAGEAPAGPFARAAGRVDCANIGHWIDEAREAGCGSLDQWREIRIGRGDESAQADRVLAELTLPAREEVRGETRLRVVKIQGSLGFISAAGNGALRLVLRDEARAKDFLGPFLSAIVLAAAGEFAAADFHAIVVGARKGKSFNDIRSMRRPTMEQARSYLSDLVSDLLFGKNHYFLPIEAVDKALREIKRGGAEDLPDLINDLRDNEFAKCSSDYGPIRNARRFEPPTAEAVKRILERRFGLLRAIFAREKH